MDPLTNDSQWDKDWDGWTNIQEYRGNSNPSNDTSAPKVSEAYSIDNRQYLYRIDLLTGETKRVGDTRYSGDFQGLAFAPDGKLYAIESDGSALLTINTQNR